MSIGIKYTYKSNIKSNQISNQIRYHNGQWATKQRTCKQKKRKMYVQHYIYTHKNIAQIQSSKFKQDTISKFTFRTQQIQVNM